MTRQGKYVPSISKKATATKREAKASVEEAIGKLIGDDGVRDAGRAKKLDGKDPATVPKNRRP